MASSPPLAPSGMSPAATASATTMALVSAAATRKPSNKPKPKPNGKPNGKPTKAKPPKEPKRPKLKWRTRDSQNSQLYNLQLDINDLQQEIQHLQQMRDILSAQRLNRMDDRDGSYIKVVREYHHVFQHGQSANTMEFLSRVMDDRVSIGRFVGLNMMYDQWTRYSTALCDLYLRYISSKVLPQMDYVTPSGVVRPVVMVSSEASYESIFTIETIEMMFPHLLQHKSVIEKLLGRKFRGLAHFDFVFDTNSHRVIGYDFRLDFFEAFARLLHDPEDLCLLFEGAKISEEFLIGDLNVYPQSAETSESSNSHSGVEKRSSEGGASGETAAAGTQHWDDPIVAKYASQRNRAQDKRDMHTRQLHSKLTNILDPVDRVPVPPGPACPTAVPVAPLPAYRPVAATFPLQAQQPQQRYQQQQQYHAVMQPNRPRPWQLQLTSILHDAPADANEPEEEMRHEGNDQFRIQEWRDTPRLPSISYFPTSALGEAAGEAATRSVPLLGKRSNPFGSEQFQSFPQ